MTIMPEDRLAQRSLLSVLLVFAYMNASLLAWKAHFWGGLIGWDFTEGYYAAAWMIRKGISLYNRPLLGMTLEDLGITSLHTVRHYNQIPISFAAFLPFTGLAPRTANLLWFVLTQLVMLSAVLLFLRRLKWTEERTLFLALLIVLWRPLYVSFEAGQIWPAVILLCAAGMSLLSRGKIPSAGLAFALAIAFKFQMLPILLFFLFWRRWRLLVWIAEIYAGFLLLSTVIAGADWPAHMIHNIIRNTRSLETSIDSSTHGVVRRLFETLPATHSILEEPLVILPITLVLIGIVGFFWIRGVWGRRWSDEFGFVSREFGFFSLTLLLLFPHCNDYAYTLAVFAFPEILDRIFSPFTTARARGLLLAGLLLTGIDMFALVFDNPRLPHPLPGWTPHLAWCGCLLLWVLLLIPRLSREGALIGEAGPQGEV